MKFTTLGKSNLRVSEIAMGCMSLQSANTEAVAVIHKAIDYGVNFFDTADLYENGKNEEIVGKALQGKRQDIILATKVGNQMNPDGQSWRWNPTKKYVLNAIDSSLVRLKTDYIDLYQLHGGTIDDPIDETIEAFEILIAQGKIRAYGISSIRPNVIREYVQRSNITSVMIQYSLLDRRPEESCLALLNDAGISVITRGSLAKGLLAGKDPAPYLDHSKDTVAAISKNIREMAIHSDRSRTHIACDYVLQQKAVAAAVIGFRTIAQVNDLLGNYTDNRLSEKSFLSLQGDSRAVSYYTEHR